jgi:predicted PurR-regulated permease PerM
VSASSSQCASRSHSSGPDWALLAVVAGIFLFGETLADYVLSPRIIGSRVKLNPVWLMFALFAFGYLFGFVGLLVAIPLAASLGVVLRFALERSQTSLDLSIAPQQSAVAPKSSVTGEYRHEESPESGC